MKTIRKIHFWIGLLASLFLFIESLTGLIMYVNGEERGRIEGLRNFNRMNGQPFLEDSQNGNRSIPPAIGQRNRDFLDRGRGINSWQRMVRELHTGPVGLVSSIGMLIMTGTGLAISFHLLLTRRKINRQKRPVT
ncbi:pepSY-associated TM helix domain-containing protein [Parageobacillus genomosp. 1]|uniref:PepSY-associated TM helix domain-containing protein n=1 Tax=Parageobacillus genomosp. 1 TaxID=1295642 RepID=A0ABC9VID0_9BACL|nr:PepSY domain-containing protein [Parageobacillus genomosp. 1]EZP78580.1 pepSY-associated TM helix domain-containing protein [Parageobacillus genomosp. 1]